MEFLNDEEDEVVTIRNANAVTNQLQHCQLLASNDNVVVVGNRKLCIASVKASELSITKSEALFKLLETNMKELYTRSGWGWSEVDKRKDLFSPLSHLLLLYTNGDGAESTEYCDSSTIAGYVCYRFEWDDDDEPEFPVVYCYELQVSGVGFQGLGVGTYLMGLLYKIAKWHRIRKIVLTVFKINELALKFYNKINFKIDGSSPSKFGDNTCNYEILSLKVKV